VAPLHGYVSRTAFSVACRATPDWDIVVPRAKLSRCDPSGISQSPDSKGARLVLSGLTAPALHASTAQRANLARRAKKQPPPRYFERRARLFFRFRFSFQTDDGLLAGLKAHS